jgi:hypothetical protein
MPTHYAGTSEETLAQDTFIKLTRAADSVTTRLAGAHTAVNT